MSESTLSYKRDEIIKILRDLDMIVVSLDRIGSAAVDVGKAELDRMTSDFIRDWDVFEKLANARLVLSEPFSRELGDDEMEELEREVQDVEYWTSANPKPTCS